METRRLVYVGIDVRFMVEWFLKTGSDSPNHFLIAERTNLPDGYTVHAVNYDFNCHEFRILVEHPSFDVVPDGCQIPRWGKLEVNYRVVRIIHPAHDLWKEGTDPSPIIRTSLVEAAKKIYEDTSGNS